MLNTKSVHSYAKLYSTVLCVFISLVTVIELAIGQNKLLLISECASDIYSYVTTCAVINVAFCIIPLIGWCCLRYILLNIIMMCSCFIFLLKSTWTFYIFAQYFDVDDKYNNRNCVMTNTFYNELGIINIEMLLTMLNILIALGMLYFLRCTKKYITQKHLLRGSQVTNDKTECGEIKTDTYIDTHTNQSSGGNTVVVRTSDMDRILYFISGVGMLLIGLHHVLCYVNNKAPQNTTFYNETVKDLEAYAVFSTSLYAVCGTLLLVLIFNTKNIASAKIAVGIFIIYIVCMVWIVIMCNAIQYVLSNYSDGSGINKAYDIYSIVQFDSIALFFMVIVPFAFANFSSIYVISTEDTWDELIPESTAQHVTAELADEYSDEYVDDAIVVEYSAI